LYKLYRAPLVSHSNNFTQNWVLAPILVNCLLKQHNSHLWSLLYLFLAQSWSNWRVELIFEQHFILVQWKTHAFCIVLRKRKIAPIRTHNLPHTPYIKMHPLHFSTQCHPCYCCEVFVVAGIRSWIRHEMRSIQFSHARIRYHCAQTLIVQSITLSQIHSTWYHPTCWIVLIKNPTVFFS